jgi:hypothetical protein
MMSADHLRYGQYMSHGLHEAANSMITLWSSALLKRPPVVRLVDSFPAFYGTRRFNTEFTIALHLFLF